MPANGRLVRARWSVVARAGVRSIRHGRVPGVRVAHATGTQAAIRVALWMFPYRVVDTYLSRRCARLREGSPWHRDARTHAATPSQIAWRVAVAGKFVPRSTCLVNALTGQQLMAADGYDTIVRFGAKADSHQSAESPGSTSTPAAFAAHAWLELDGRAVIGGDVSAFAAFRAVPRRQA